MQDGEARVGQGDVAAKPVVGLVRPLQDEFVEHLRGSFPAGITDTDERLTTSVGMVIVRCLHVGIDRYGDD